LLDMPAVAALLATSVRHVQRLVSEQRIPYLKVGRFVRFDPAEVSAWLDEQRVEMYVPPHLAHRYGR
jgi:excisionase family DNA binding protein